MKYDYIIWDFNGTILDDTEAGINSENVLLARRNMPLIQSKEQYRDLFCFPIEDYYRKLGHDFKKESYHDLSVEWVEQYLNFVKQSKLQEGLMQLLKRFRREGLQQVILSATELSMLKMQVNDLGISDFFSELVGLDNIHAASKLDVAKEWVKRTKPENALLIGDTTHDYEVSSAIGARCVLIACGHQNKEALLACTDCVYDNLLDLGNALL